MSAVVELAPDGLQLLEKRTDDPWARCGGIELQLRVVVEVEGITFGVLKSLQAGSLVRTDIKRGNPFPLEVNQAQIGWCELEESSGKLAARISEWK